MKKLLVGITNAEEMKLQKELAKQVKKFMKSGKKIQIPIEGEWITLPSEIGQALEAAIKGRK